MMRKFVQAVLIAAAAAATAAAEPLPKTSAGGYQTRSVILREPAIRKQIEDIHLNILRVLQSIAAIHQWSLLPLPQPDCETIPAALDYAADQANEAAASLRKLQKIYLSYTELYGLKILARDAFLLRAEISMLSAEIMDTRGIKRGANCRCHPVFDERLRSILNPGLDKEPADEICPRYDKELFSYLGRFGRALENLSNSFSETIAADYSAILRDFRNSMRDSWQKQLPQEAK